MDNSKKTMEKIVALCKGRGFVYRALKFTADLQTPGTSDLLALHLKTISKMPGSKSLFRKTNIT